MARRAGGLKTEPAFAAILNVPGDRGTALPELYEPPDKALPTIV